MKPEGVAKPITEKEFLAWVEKTWNECYKKA